MERNETEAMNIIINIQTMQDALYGKHFEHADFKGNTIDELRKIQDELIVLYNKYNKPA